MQFTTEELNFMLNAVNEKVMKEGLSSAQMGLSVASKLQVEAQQLAMVKPDAPTENKEPEGEAVQKKNETAAKKH